MSLFSRWLLFGSQFASFTVTFGFVRSTYGGKSIRSTFISQTTHLTKTLLVASLLSVTAWLPVSATLLVSVLCKNCLSLNNSSRAVYAARILQFGNSLLNPVIYNIRMPEFRAKLMRLLFRRHSRVSIQSSYLTPGTLPNFTTQSATPVLLSLIPLASSGRINSSISNQEREKWK